MTAKLKRNITRIKDPGSAITHFIAMLLALFSAAPLLVRTSLRSGSTSLAAMSVFICSMILLYGASTLYHSVNASGKIIRIFKKLDHMMIFILIAGTYTPVCLITLKGPVGISSSGGSMGHRPDRYHHQGLLDQLSEMVLFRALYLDGLDLPVRVRDTLEAFAARRLFLAFGGRDHLYCRRDHLCAQASHFQRAPQILRLPRDLHLFVMAGSLCHFIFMFVYLA